MTSVDDSVLHLSVNCYKIKLHLLQFDIIFLFILVLLTTAVYDPLKKILSPKKVNIKCPFPDFDSSGQVSSRLPEKVHRAAEVLSPQLPSLLCLFSPEAIIQQAESHSHTDGRQPWTFSSIMFNKFFVFYGTKQLQYNMTLTNNSR